MQDRFRHLGDWLADESGASSLQIRAIEKLAGGAIQENWRVLLQANTGSLSHCEQYVLRTDAPSSIGESGGRDREFALLRAAHQAGVSVAKTYILCPDSKVIGTPFFIMDFCTGQAQARKITRHPELAEFGSGLAAMLGREMARIHAMTSFVDCDLAFLPDTDLPAASAQILDSRVALDDFHTGQPVLEYGLNWLEERLNRWQKDSPKVLCHRDFRTGNYLVEAGRLSAVLDWEFAGWSDPEEDIGWLCAHCWRFGNGEQPVGGIAGFDAFRSAYEDESGRKIDRRAVAYWQVVAEIRWAIIALQQQQRMLRAGEVSLELALSGFLAPEMERNMLNLITLIESGQEIGPL